jgi:hypothetical protein
MAEQNNCEKSKTQIEEEIASSLQSQSTSFYKEPSEGSKFYGLESHFNEDVSFYKDVRVYGELNFNASTFFQKNVTFNKINVLGDADFYGNVYVDKNLNAGIITARKRLDVGCGGTTLRADVATSNVGIGSTIPQQKLDVAGSVKIDVTVYDSVNAPGQNGYFLTRDETGIRWVPLIAENGPPIPGIATDGIFVLNEGVPLY